MAKQASAISTTGKANRKVPSLPGYIQESRNELKKVTWPTREVTLQLTYAVIAMVLAIAIFLGLIDKALLEMITRFLTGNW